MSELASALSLQARVAGTTVTLPLNTHCNLSSVEGQAGTFTVSFQPGQSHGYVYLRDGISLTEGPRESFLPVDPGGRYRLQAHVDSDDPDLTLWVFEFSDERRTAYFRAKRTDTGFNHVWIARPKTDRLALALCFTRPGRFELGEISLTPDSGSRVDSGVRYPELYRKFLRFKQNFTRETDTKTRHYEVIKGIVATPLLSVHESVHDVDWDVLPERFVIKTDIGTFTTGVKCLERTGLEEYTDHLRRPHPTHSRAQLVDFFSDKGRILIERFLHNPHQGDIPYDVKVYVAYDEVLYVRVVDRNHARRTVAIFDGDLRRVPHLEFFHPDNHDIDPHPHPMLSETGMRHALKVSVAIGRRLLTPFVSVDLYVLGDNDVVLGELTWAPGPLVFEPMQEAVVAHLLERIESKQRELAAVEGSLA